MEFLLRLLKVSVIAGAATALLGLLGPALRRRYHAKWRYWVWLCLAVLLLSPLVPLPELEGETVYHAPVQVEVPAMEVTYNREEGLSLAPQTTLVLPSAPAADSTPSSEAGETTPVVTVPESSPKPAETAQKIPVETVLLVLWAVGAAASALWVLGETAFFSRQCMRWARRPNEETAAVLAAEKEALGVSGPVSLWVTSGTASPAAIGLFRRKIFLPEAGCKAEQLRFVLRHELVHLKRRDLWFQLLLCMARAVHWFNPLVWLLVRQAREDMELTCDDAVLRGAEQADRRSYSETLLAMLHRQRSGALTTHFYGGKELMKERFRNIMTGQNRRRGTAALCIALLLTTVALGAVACTARKPEPLNEEELAMWQERVESEEWYGFFAQYYTDVRHLDLDDIFAYGAGLGQEVTDPTERAEALALLGLDGEDDTPVLRYTREDMDAFLREKTGLGLEELAQSGKPLLSSGTEDGVFYRVRPSWGVTYMGNAPQVAAGERLEDTVTLLLDLTDSGYYGHGGGMETATMTIEDGKVVSFTNEVFTAVEKAAEPHLEETIQTLTDAGLTVETAVMKQPDFQGWDRENYTLWYMEEQFKVQETTEEALALLGDNWYSEDGWLHQRNFGPWRLVARKESDRISVWNILEEEITSWPCFGAYVRYDLEEGLTPTQWPQNMEDAISLCMAESSDWIFQREEVVRRYVEALGETAASITVLEDDLRGDGGASWSVELVEVETEAGWVMHLVLHQVHSSALAPYLSSDGTCWQVVGCGTPDGSAAPETPLPEYYQWLSGYDQEQFWTLDQDWYTLELPEEDAAAFPLFNGIQLGMTPQEVVDCIGYVPSDAALHGGGSLSLVNEGVTYIFSRTTLGEVLTSVQIREGASVSLPPALAAPGDSLANVLMALGYEGHPLRQWAEDVLYSDPDTGDILTLNYSTMLDCYQICRQEGAIFLRYTFDRQDQLQYIDLVCREGVLTYLGTRPAPPAPEGIS